MDIPAVSHHAHAFALGLAIEFGTLLQVFLATDTLGVAKAGLGESITITPS